MWTLGVLALLNGNLLSGADWKVLPGHVPAAVARMTPLGALARTNQMRLAIGVPLRDSAGLDQFLAQLYDPASTNYHKYLTPEEFTARFGPTEQDYQSVIQFARANGLTVTQTHSNRLVLDVAGPAAAVESALHIRLQTYQHPTEGRQFFAPDGEPTVAASLPVADIQGLTDYVRPHPRLKKSDAASASKAVARDGSAPDGSGGIFGNDFRNAYAPGVTLTGSGQMVGLLEFDGYYSSDVSAYASAAGNSRSNITVQKVLLDGFNGVPTTGPNSGSDEVDLDVEMAMAMAPGLSKILVFEAGPNGNQNDILNSMVSYSTVKNLACCWGWGDGPSTTTDAIFKEMAAQGQSFFNAAGDSDAFTVEVNSVNGVDNPNNANAPSSCPYITQVGGTTLNLSGSGASYYSETVWNWGGGEGSSGGISSYYSIPSWQTNLSMSANGGSTSQRNIPDVALTADNVFVYYEDGTSGEFGGTSCAAPLWAAFMALVNQQATSLGNSAVGFINPAVYAIGKGQNAGYGYAACFHDTTSGNNYWSSSPNAYAAVSGYDLCTGWGTPKGASLINALAGTTSSDTTTTNTTTTTTVTNTGSFTIWPATGFAFVGVTGGPFTPTSGTFKLTNGTSAAVAWTLVSTSSWLAVSAGSGTVASNSTASVTISLASAANSLKATNYTTSLAFSNSTSKVVALIPVTLQISTGMTVAPATGFAPIGAVGGPFAPSSASYVLSNASGSSLKWGLSKTASANWLATSASAGSISAGGQTTVTLSLSSVAKTLRAGVYAASAVFTNAYGTLATVPVTLSIGQSLVQNGGFEMGSFSGWTQSGNKAYTSVGRGSANFVHSGVYGAELGPSGSPGYLSQTIATTAGKSYTLSLWLRNSAGSTPTWFQVQWNGTAIFAQQNFAAAVWTNLQFTVTATSSSSVLQLGFEDDPGFLGLDDISLTAVTGSSVKAIVRRLDDFNFTWNTTAGATYQVQYKTNLAQSDWINLGAAATVNDSTFTMTDTNALQLSPQRFYRLQVVSPP
jgi:hypothetical protein